MTVLRTGILCVPEWDEETVAAVRHELRTTIPSAYIVLSTSVGSQRYWIEDVLRRWCDEEEVDLILTIGDTLPAPGPSAREWVPEATATVIERPLPGLPEAMRAHAATFSKMAFLDRGTAGVRSRTLIVNLPAGTNAAQLFLHAVVDLLEPISAHLRSEPSAPPLHDAPEMKSLDRSSVSATAQDSLPSTGGHGSNAENPEQPQPSGLDPDEFAAFLQRRASQKD